MCRYSLRFLGEGMSNDSGVVEERNFYRTMHYSAKCGIAIACSLSVRMSIHLSVCLSVALVDQYNIGWKSWKLITWTISPIPSLFVARKSSTYSQGSMGKF